MSLRRTTVTLVLALSTLAACSSGEDEPAAEPTETSSSPTAAASTPSMEVGSGRFPRYVALGDSYTAAPLVPPVSPGDACLKSTANYPNLVAAELEGTVLADVSCSGADSTSLIGVQELGDGTTRPPQLSFVTEQTSLVTLSMGGNDLQLFSTLVGECVRAAQDDPDGSPCTDAAGDQVPETLATIEGRVGSAVAGILDRAPDARVVVVGYPQIIPPRGSSCFERLPIAEGDLPFARQVNRGLSRALEQAAAAAEVEYVDTFALTAGHDVCADDPWINGLEGELEAAPFHPTAQEQQAVADEILRLIG